MGLDAKAAILMRVILFFIRLLYLIDAPYIASTKNIMVPCLLAGVYKEEDTHIYEGSKFIFVQL